MGRLQGMWCEAAVWRVMRSDNFGTRGEGSGDIRWGAGRGVR